MGLCSSTEPFIKEKRKLGVDLQNSHNLTRQYSPQILLLMLTWLYNSMQTLTWVPGNSLCNWEAFADWWLFTLTKNLWKASLWSPSSLALARLQRMLLHLAKCNIYHSEVCWYKECPASRYTVMACEMWSRHSNTRTQHEHCFSDEDYTGLTSITSRGDQCRYCAKCPHWPDQDRIARQYAGSPGRPPIILVFLR